MAKAMREIDLLVIHCADTPNGKPFTVKDIDVWHKERGFIRKWQYQQDFNPELGHIGYHYVIYTDGSIHSGRSEFEIGAHAQGFNSRSLGVCMVGRDKFSLAQWSALQGLVTMLMEKYDITDVKGHRQLPNVTKSCPGFDVTEWIDGSMAPVKGHIC